MSRVANNYISSYQFPASNLCSSTSGQHLKILANANALGVSYVFFFLKLYVASRHISVELTYIHREGTYINVSIHTYYVQETMADESEMNVIGEQLVVDR